MSSANRGLLWLPVVTAVLVSCSSDSTGARTPVEPEPPPAQVFSAIRVGTTTTGQDIDLDGYLISLDGAEPQPIGLEADVLFSSLSAGTHQLELSGLDLNCSDPAGPSRTVQTAGGDAALVSFQIDCFELAGDFTYDVGAGVSDRELKTIKEGFWIAAEHLDTHLGGDIREAVRQTVTVKIVATGEGNQELGGGGACCTAFAINSAGDLIIRPFFDVEHEHWKALPHIWSDINARHRKIVVHEHAHGWYGDLGCIRRTGEQIPFWLNEGVAEYVAYEASITGGFVDPDTVNAFMIHSARVTGQLDRTLEDLAPNGADVWPGHVGYVATRTLVESAPERERSVRQVCEDASAQPFVDAFRSAFGLELDTFYAEFEEWRLANR